MRAKGPPTCWRWGVCKDCGGRVRYAIGEQGRKRCQICLGNRKRDTRDRTIRYRENFLSTRLHPDLYIRSEFGMTLTPEEEAKIEARSAAVKYLLAGVSPEDSRDGHWKTPRRDRGNH